MENQHWTQLIKTQDHWYSRPAPQFCTDKILYVLAQMARTFTTITKSSMHNKVFKIKSFTNFYLLHKSI